MADHRSDCAVHNGPAMPAGACDCGIDAATAARAEIVAWIQDRQPLGRTLPVTQALQDFRDMLVREIIAGAPQRWAAEREEQGRG